MKAPCCAGCDDWRPCKCERCAGEWNCTGDAIGCPCALQLPGLAELDLLARD